MPRREGCGPPENCRSLFRALREFWQDPVPGIANEKELLERGSIFQFGVPPNSIDLLNDIDGVSFGECWENRTEVDIAAGLRVRYIGLSDLVRNKEASGRDKDRDDLRFLKRLLAAASPAPPPEGSFSRCPWTCGRRRTDAAMGLRWIGNASSQDL